MTIVGIGAGPGHHEHRRPSTGMPTEASGWRRVRRSIALLVPQPAEHVKPWRASERRGPDRGRPQHVAAEGKLVVPSLK